MVRREHRMVIAAVAMILLGITSTQAEAPLDGYNSYSPNGGYASSSPGYAYGPPKATGIPGRAGVDYPDFTEVPPTSFSCDRVPVPGYYADPEAGCQVYHVCEKGVKEREPMLCPVGSIFDQEKLTCAWWYTVDCGRSVAAASAVNAEVVAAMEEADARARANKYGYGRGKPSGAYGPPSNAYGPPSGVAGIPVGSYAAPSASYGAPSSAYRAPFGGNSLRRVYGAPSNGIGGLFNGAIGSSRRIGSPSRAYGAPQFGGSALSGSYGAPSIGSPSQEYGAPGGAYLPPSF